MHWCPFRYVELNIDSSEIPEFKSLTFLRFITFCQQQWKFYYIKISQKTAMIFIHYIMHKDEKIIYLEILDKGIAVYLRFEVYVVYDR